MSGSVHRTDGAPVSGAFVTAVIPDTPGGENRLSAKTDAHGKFSTTGIGIFDDKCHLEVLVIGEPLRKFPVMDYCTDGDKTGCGTIVADLVIPNPPTQ